MTLTSHLAFTYTTEFDVKNIFGRTFLASALFLIYHFLLYLLGKKTIAIYIHTYIHTCTYYSTSSIQRTCTAHPSAALRE